MDSTGFEISDFIKEYPTFSLECDGCPNSIDFFSSESEAVEAAQKAGFSICERNVLCKKCAEDFNANV